MLRQVVKRGGGVALGGRRWAGGKAQNEQAKPSMAKLVFQLSWISALGGVGLYVCVFLPLQFVLRKVGVLSVPAVVEQLETYEVDALKDDVKTLEKEIWLAEQEINKLKTRFLVK